MSYLGQEIPKLGFGLMRLPMLGEDVDIEQTKQMVDLFIERGFTYFDTAYGYIDGKSEKAAKVALVDRYPRESFKLATKLPAWAGAKDAEEARQMFFTSLERTGAGYFDFYLLHNCGGMRTQVFEEFGIWDFVKEQKEKGLIKHIGFSFHDKADALEEILTAHPDVEFVQLQINYADWEDDLVESRKCWETARRHGKPVVIMEPVKGGALADMPPRVSEPMTGYAPDMSQASWAIRFAASLEGIITVLSGMSTLDQMKDNLSFMEHFKPLTDEERAVIEEVRKRLAETKTIPCTRCRYCVKDCPQGIAIPRVLSSMNTYLLYGSLKNAKGDYFWATHDNTKASACIACGQCEGVCPQHIHIIDELKRCVEMLEE